MEKIIVNSDALDVISRIKNWNNKYEVLFIPKLKKFVLYLFENELVPPIYCLTFPYEQIDERMIDYVQKSEVQNRKHVLKEMEESNALLLKKEQKKILEKMEKLSDSKRNY